MLRVALQFLKDNVDEIEGLTTDYDDTTCDGLCLIGDIENILS